MGDIIAQRTGAGSPVDELSPLRTRPGMAGGQWTFHTLRTAKNSGRVGYGAVNQSRPGALFAQPDKYGTLR